MHVLVSEGPTLRDLLEDALALMDEKGVKRPSVSRQPLFEELYMEEELEMLPKLVLDINNPAIIMHSSGTSMHLPMHLNPQFSLAGLLFGTGSTAYPKPIAWTHRRLLDAAVNPCKFTRSAFLFITPPLIAICADYGEIDLTGLRWSCHAVPMFHAMGVFQTGWTVCFSSLVSFTCMNAVLILICSALKASCGYTLTVNPPHSPPIPTTPESVIEGVRKTKSDFVFCVPSFVEMWAKSEEDIATLKNLRAIVSYSFSSVVNIRANNHCSFRLRVVVL